jgi:ABC-type multidrug transport system ATPase subunit/pSer/pThr/pTyr-binding forkhead associated (FHA) protein
VRWPGGRSEEHPLAKPVVTIGRAPGNDILLNFPTVSSNHLRLEVSTGALRITDLRSTNGTQLNGRRIQPDTPHPIQAGDVIRIGDLHGNSLSMTIKVPGGASLHTRPLGTSQMAGLSQVLLGRDPACQIHLDHPSVSRHHAEIVRQGANYSVRDLRSANGTFVNGQRVANWQQLQLSDVVQVGPFKLVYGGQQHSLTTSVSRGHRLDAIGLGKKVSSGRMILRDITLSVQAGEFIALVGGSGAGKSTLLKAMNGFNPATHGQMLIDGGDLYTSLDAYRMLMGYVPQDDIIHRELPVRRALWYAAKIRIPDASEAEIDRRIKDVLQMVEMAPHAEKPVKVLSGGQRKRVSIAVELLAQPDMLFLDEPTSGLDPGLEKKMMYDLNRLADQGRTIVLVTHATANIEQCNSVAFLTQGSLSYFGPPQAATKFFQTNDFADIYLKLSQEVNPAGGKPPPQEVQAYQPQVQAQLAENNGDQSYEAGLLWAEHYRRSPDYQQYIASRQQEIQGQMPAGPSSSSQQKKHGRDSWIRQLFILSRRQFELIRHDLRTLFILLLMMPLIALLFMFVSGKNDLTSFDTAEEASAFYEDKMDDKVIGEQEQYAAAATATALVTMLTLALTQAGVFGAANQFIKERPVFKRERSVNLKVGPYVLSKVLVLGVFAVFQVAIVIAILSLKVDMSFEPIFSFFPNGVSELFVTLFIAVLASIMLGLFISAAVPSADVVLYIILGQLFIQIILSGTLFPLGDNPASKMVISHWAMDGMGATVDMNELNEAKNWICAKTAGEPDCNPLPGPLANLELNYEHSGGHLAFVWAMLLLQLLFWGGLTIFIQARRKSD